MTKPTKPAKCTTCGRPIKSWVKVRVDGVWGKYCFEHAREAVRVVTHPREIKYATT